LALSLEPLEPRAELRANLITRLFGSERLAPFATDLARVFGLTYAAARAALLHVDDANVWRDGLWPGSRVLTTPELLEASAVIARLPAAARIPKHPHTGRELTLVLQGCLIEDGQTQHGPGDVLDMPAGSEHAISVSSDAECLVVFFPLRP
jgi:anti-sigma factor ChrR (cupin superfamily)